MFFFFFFPHIEVFFVWSFSVFRRDSWRGRWYSLQLWIFSFGILLRSNVLCNVIHQLGSE